MYNIINIQNWYNVQYIDIILKLIQCTVQLTYRIDKINDCCNVELILNI